MAKPLIAVEEIYEVSLSILDTDGVKGLSMRRLASALKCSPNTLYQLIGNREELIRQLLHYYFDAFELDWDPTPPWQESAFNWARAVRSSLRSHPNLSRLISSQFREVIVNHANRLLNLFRQNFFAEELAMRCCRVMALQVISLSLSELDTPALKVRRQKQSPKEIAYDDLIISTQNKASGNNITRENLHDHPELFENAIRFTIVGIEQELDHYKS